MNIIRQWAIMSIITGLGAVISYTLIVVLSGPYIALAESGNPVVLQLAALFNILGAAIFTMMLLVQLAVGYQIQCSLQ